MKAIVVPAFGGPEVLQYIDQPDPKPAAGQLLIRVRAVGVNPVDTYVRSGAYGAFEGKPPFIPGTELAGEIAEGPRKGERVFAIPTVGPKNTGAWAELAVVKNAWTLPDRLSFAQGAAIPVAFATAYRALVEVGGLKQGQTVLIHGASGGVGNAATQLASNLGAIVIGTGSTPEGQQLIRDAGAKFVFNHKDAGYRDQIKQATGGRGVDLVIEFLANVNLDHDLDLLAKNGHVVVVGSRGRIEIDPRKMMGKETSISGMTMWGAGEEGIGLAFEAVGALLNSGTITPVVATELPLAQAAKASELVMQGGSRGKIVLTV